MLYLLSGKPIAHSRKHTHTLVTAINLDRAYLVALDVLIVRNSEPLIGKVILSSLFPASFLASLLSFLSFNSGRIL